MKKILTYAAVAAVSLTALSCTEDRYVETTPVTNTTVVSPTQVLEAKTSFTADNSYLAQYDFTPGLTDGNTVLVYRRVASQENQVTWQLLPQSFQLTNGLIYYSNSFNNKTVYISAGTNFALTAAEESAYRLNQTFRIVVIPSKFAKGPAVDTSDYDAVVKAYGLTSVRNISL